MKKIFSLVMILIMITSCRALTTKGRSVNSAEKYAKSGNYYDAVLEFTNALVNDFKYKPAIEGLNEIYSEAIKKQENQILDIKQTGNLINYANETEKMVLLYRNVSRLRAETFALLHFKIESEDIRTWTLETSKAYYEAAKNYTPRQTSFDYKTINKLYKKSYDYNPRYLDVFDRYKETKELAMQKVVYFDIKKEFNYLNVGNLLSNKMFNLLMNDSSINEYTRFVKGENLKLTKETLLSKNFTENELKDTNYFLDIEISNINFTKPKVSTNYTNKTWYEVKKNVNGIIKSDAIWTLPKTLDSLATYEEKKYTEIKSYKESIVKMAINYSLIDLKTKSVVKQGVISDEFKDSHTSQIFVGENYPNEKSILDRELLSDFDMINKVSETLSEKIKRELQKILE
ncbi:MAG: hypothetical protein JXM74_01640 [Fusobacteriaceae bacterium]|nr:hypothetical protein [Fusobacteriaceae bacterium]